MCTVQYVCLCPFVHITVLKRSAGPVFWLVGCAALLQEHVAALRAEEQKTVEGVSGILESLAQVPGQ